MNLESDKDQTMGKTKKKNDGALEEKSNDKKEGFDEDDDDIDFERDEDQADVENVQEDDGDSGNKVSNHTIIKRNNNQVNVSVKIYTKNAKNKKKKGKKKKKQPEKQEEEFDPNFLLDVLFSFIGVSSKNNTSKILQT